MAFKDIIIPVLSVAEEDAALYAAEVVADTADGHLTAVYLEIEPDPIVAGDGYVCGEVWDQITGSFADEARRAKAALEHRGWSRRAAMRELRTRPRTVGEDFAMIARSGDLTVMRRPAGGGLADPIRASLFEATLFSSGRPLLLVPPNWRGGIGRRILVAWNGKRESARAIADAAPFLEAADCVAVVTLANQDRGAGEAIAANLAHHGVKAEVIVRPTEGDDEGRELAKAALAFDADLLVMGGYGHARAAEFVFGGVTRTLSRSAPIPVLMSH